MGILFNYRIQVSVEIRVIEDKSLMRWRRCAYVFLLHHVRCASRRLVRRGVPEKSDKDKHINRIILENMVHYSSKNLTIEY